MRISFVYRSDRTPRILQGQRPMFLGRGRITLDAGYSQMDDGRVVAHIKVQQAPGPRLDLRGGRLSFRPTGTQALLLTYSSRTWFPGGRIEGFGVEDFREGLTRSADPAVRAVQRARALPAGYAALTDFAYFGVNKTDPNNFYVETSTDLNSGNGGAPFTRMHGVFVPGRRARYLAVGAKIYDMPETGTRKQYLRKWMLEVAPFDGGTYPSPKYGKAREVVAKIRPDRMNWSPNPGFKVNTTNWMGVTRVAYAAAASGFAGMDTVPANSWDSVNHVIPKVLKDRVYAASVRVSGPNTVKWTPVVTGATTLAVQALPPSSEGHFLRVQFKATNTGPVTLNYRFDNLAGAEATVYFFNMIVERTDSWNKSYFDGDTNEDCIWEQGETAGASRSYWYENRAERLAAVKRILEENVPMGIGISEPVMGTPPVD